MVYIIPLCYVILSKVVLCPLPSLFHAVCLSPIQTHKPASTIFWRDNQKIAGLGREILYNIQPPNPTQYWSCWRPWGCPNSSPGVPGSHHTLTCLGIWSSKGCHTSTCSGIASPRGPRRSSRLDLPRDPILERLSCLTLPVDFISRRLSRLSLPGDLHPDLEMPGSEVATVLGRISFRKTHP